MSSILLSSLSLESNVTALDTDAQVNVCLLSSYVNYVET